AVDPRHVVFTKAEQREERDGGVDIGDSDGHVIGVRDAEHRDNLCGRFRDNNASMTLTTRFTELFGITHPLISAPMAMHSGAPPPPRPPVAMHGGGPVAGAASAAGGLGSYGGLHSPEPPSWILDQAAIVREQTDRPFVIGFITPFPGFTEPYFEAALEARPAA